MSLNHPSMIDVPGVPSSDVVICEPVLVVGPMTCRRGTGSRSSCQGQPIQKCDGLLKPSKIGNNVDVLACSKCGLTHDTVMVNGVKHYGAML